MGKLGLTYPGAPIGPVFTRSASLPPQRSRSIKLGKQRRNFQNVRRNWGSTTDSNNSVLLNSTAVFDSDSLPRITSKIRHYRESGSVRTDLEQYRCGGPIWEVNDEVTAAHSLIARVTNIIQATLAVTSLWKSNLGNARSVGFLSLQ